MAVRLSTVDSGTTPTFYIHSYATENIRRRPQSSVCLLLSASFCELQIVVVVAARYVPYCSRMFRVVYVWLLLFVGVVVIVVAIVVIVVAAAAFKKDV